MNTNRRRVLGVERKKKEENSNIIVEQIDFR
jgi:hypothetical protein